MAQTSYPLLTYLKNGISGPTALKLLRENDCLSFPQLQSGLFPAANFDNLEADETGMSNAWLRDSACIGIILLQVGEKEVATKAARAVIKSLQSVRAAFEETIAAGHAPEDDKKRPPVRYTGQESTPLYNWANAQNDALGYALQFIGMVNEEGVFELGTEEIEMIDRIVRYLSTIEYWHDAESGHWEEIKKVNASSVGTVVAGLQAVQSRATDKELVAKLLHEGIEALRTTLPNESLTPGMQRTDDSALIFLVEPQRLITGGSAARIIHNAEQHLMGEHGFRRYNGDSYWGHDYREHFLVGDRAADFSDPKDMTRRDQFLFPGGEAQWTFFDPVVAAYYARKYKETGDQSDAEAAEKFMARALSSITVHPTEPGKSVWRMPELFFLENNEWVPNDHLGLLWGQANLLYGLKVYQDVFGDKPIISNAQ